MRRRKFIGLITGAAVGWPLALHAQRPAMPVIGYLGGATLEVMRSEIMRSLLAAFRGGLSDAGFTEGRNLAIEYRWAEGHNDRLPALAADLVSRGVAAIVVVGSTPGALAAKAATQTIPIVFLVGTDPVQVGLVTSLARPGGNITGITLLNVELIGKSLEVMHNLMPPATTIAVLLNPANVPQTANERVIVQDTASALSAHIVILNAGNPSEVESAFANLASERVGALVVSGENFFLTQRDRLIELAAYHAVPTIYSFRDFAVAGGLMSYGSDIAGANHHVGVTTGRILKGEKTADLPVQQVTKVELVINLKTAKTLGLSIPLPLLGRADEVIE